MLQIGLYIVLYTLKLTTALSDFFIDYISCHYMYVGQCMSFLIVALTCLKLTLLF